MRHVISLSTVPPRFSQLGPSLASLVRQRSRPEAVELYIPRSYRRFPQWGGGLPEVPEGVTIVRVDEDLGPATKILPAARAWRGQDVVLIYCDDDIIYHATWAERFLAVQRARPGEVICAAATTLERMGRPCAAARREPRALYAPPFPQQPGFQMRRLARTAFGGLLTLGRNRPILLAQFRKLDRSGYADIAEGYAGVAVRPDFFDEEAFSLPPVVWSVDDVWLSGHLARHDIPIWADQSLNLAQAIIPLSRTLPLYAAVIEGADRQAANQACIDYMRQTYGIWGGVAVQST